MTFKELNLNAPLLNALNDLGFTTPTPIQIKSFPVIMSGRDVVGIAQTGTGKTFAYILPLLKQLKYTTDKHPKILIIVPTRELVAQVVEEIKKLTAYMNVRVGGVYGGANMNTQKMIVFNGLDILVATPGRLVDLSMIGALRLKAIQKLVIDEVDELLNLGFHVQLTTILDILPSKRQNIMFSATLTREVELLIDSYFNDPEKIQLAATGTPLETIVQSAYEVINFNTKINLLIHLLSNEKQFSRVLVFVKSIKIADQLYKRMVEVFPDQFRVMHSNKTQSYRTRSVKRFKEGLNRVLIATDVIARGLDVPDVTHVINFDMPQDPEDYMHRIGRTGRAGNSGIAISFITAAESENQQQVEALMRAPIPILPLPEDLEVSTLFTIEEKPVLSDKNYLKIPTIKKSQGAFHEKKEKNKKVNLGGPFRRKQNGAKPFKRGGRKTKPGR